MKITDLRRKYKEMAIEKAKTLSKDSYEYEVNIATNYTISYERHNLIAKMISGSESNSTKSLEVAIKCPELAKDWYTIGKEEQKHYEEQLLIMVEYWKEYIKLKNIKNIIFTAVNGEMNDELKKILKQVLSKELKSHHQSLLAHFFTNSSIEFVGAFLSESYQNYIEQFYKMKKIFEELMQENQLLSFPKSSIDLDMFASRFYLHYCGEELKVVPNDDFTNLELTFIRSETFSSEQFSIEVDLMALKEYFEDLKLKLRIKNELKPPMEHFKEVVLRVLSESNEEIIDDLYIELVEKLGSWEEVESECKQIYEKYDYGYRGNILNSSSDAGYKEILITKMSTSKRHYHFIMTKNVSDNKVLWDYIIYPSEDEHPSFIKNVVLEHLLPSYV